MRKSFLAILLMSIFINTQTYSQNTDTIITKVKVTSDGVLLESEKPNAKKLTTLKEPMYVFVIGKLKTQYARYVKVVSDTLVGYTFPGILSLTEEEYDNIDTSNQDWKIAKAKLLKQQLSESLHQDVTRIGKLFDEFVKEATIKENREKRFGIGIRNFKENNNDNFYNIGFEIYNWTPNVVKYVWVTATAINAVGDVVQSKKLTSIGPISSKKINEYSFENVFYSEIIDNIKISKIEYQLMNGTKKSIFGKALSDMLF